jgi:predicted PurR-regulated permease PerM
VLWGTVGGLASIIPIVGSPLVWVPIVIAFLVMGSYWKALILRLWGGVIVGSIDNVLRPLVVGRIAQSRLRCVARQGGNSSRLILDGKTSKRR